MVKWWVADPEKALHRPEAVRSAGKRRSATTRVALMGALRIPGAMRAHDGRDAGSLHAGGALSRTYRRDNGISNYLCARPLDAQTTLEADPLVDAPNVRTVQMQRPTGLSSNDDNDALQIRIEVDQCGGCTKRASPSAMGCFPSSSSPPFAVTPTRRAAAAAVAAAAAAYLPPSPRVLPAPDPPI
ncbi:hypothetical protein EVAR_5941_1 [Eumeta japonica]|uniref:Uncharacterized protein n=1 Tax=Eumeta variegata TaxID=151549 RepID=A0A4C1TEW8_EUMVA|nr:hypothetical protein EVAR_5941_1 [Eumeta japonica]